LRTKLKESRKIKKEILAEWKSGLEKYKAEPEYPIYRALLKFKFGKPYSENEKNIHRLKRMILISHGKKLNESRDYKAETSSITIVPVIEKYTDLKKRGKMFFGKCPLHTDKTPSFCVYPETNSFYCFGCGQGGDLITFLELKHGFTFLQACEYLMGAK
jgi:hypothetical protein